MGFFGGGGAAGIGGSTGATDNAVLRADGTGAATLQNSALNIDDASTSTQNNVAITNQHSGETNSALVLTPKGTGAFIVGPKPDGTSTGGNARGVNAICIRAGGRTAANQVAGASATIAIGTIARADQAGNIAIGSATATGNAQAIAIGPSSVSSSNRSLAIGNAALSSNFASSAVGDNAVASAAYAVAMSGATADLRAMFSARSFNAIYFGGTTTDATPASLNLDAEATATRFTIAANTAIMADLFIIARRTDTVDKWFSSRRIVAIRRNNSNGTAIIGSVQTIGYDQTEGSPSWSVAITADDTNEALQVEVTGAASETVQWRVLALYRVV